MRKLSLHQGVLRGKQSLFHTEHGQYISRAALKLQLREFEGALRLLRGILQAQLCLRGALYSHECVLDVAQSGQYGLVIIR